jgi:hypothetical protein
MTAVRGTKERDGAATIERQLERESLAGLLSSPGHSLFFLIAVYCSGEYAEARVTGKTSLLDTRQNMEEALFPNRCFATSSLHPIKPTSRAAPVPAETSDTNVNVRCPEARVKTRLSKRLHSPI